jgi:hypothetical protein
MELNIQDIFRGIIKKEVNDMADKVKYRELKNPGLCGVHHPWEPFTKEEIIKLTEGLKQFALITDGESLYLYAE